MKQKTYKLVNILVLLLTVLLLSRALLHRDFSFVLHSPLIFLIMLGTAVLVHAIRPFASIWSYWIGNCRLDSSSGSTVKLRRSA